jgi:hypothetical protein
VKTCTPQARVSDSGDMDISLHRDLSPTKYASKAWPDGSYQKLESFRKVQVRLSQQFALRQLAKTAGASRGEHMV